MPRRADAAVIVSRAYSDLVRSIGASPPFNSAPSTAVARELIEVMSFVMISTGDGHPRNASEIARHVGIPRETVKRRLHTLIEAGRIKLVERRYIANFEYADEVVTPPKIEEWFRIFDASAKQLGNLRATLRGRDV